MIRLERSVDWWHGVASHPAVHGALMGFEPIRIARIAARPTVLPLASENGGFFVGNMDGLGMVAELHAIYRPEGWGKEALMAGREVFDLAFQTFQVLVVHEIHGSPHSRASLSAGFVLAGDWQNTKVGGVRMAVLTRNAWESSPMRRRWKQAH